MNSLTFAISSDDCAIVNAIYKEGSLRRAAIALNLDVAGVSRKVQRISEQHQVLVKINGKWSVTDRGANLVRWMHKSIKEQERALELKQTIKIASTSWLAEQIIFSNLQEFLNKSLNTNRVSILTPLKSFELSLLEREVDFVISCHPPNNPVVAHKKIGLEKWITIVPYKWKHDINTTSNLRDYLYSRALIRHISINYNIVYPNNDDLIGENEITVNQLHSVRSAISNGVGWGCCPKLLVTEQLRLKKVLEINLPVRLNNNLSIWWLRERKDIKKNMVEIFNWIKDSI